MSKSPTTSLATRERALACAWIAAHALLRVWAALHHEVNTDEPQHLHVVWAWTQGLVQYRDVFDNHTPLFHALSAPLFAALGERADIVVILRLAMIPLVAATMLCVHAVAARLYGARVALWSVAACWLVPSFVTASVEYRADVLWMLLWALVLWALFALRWTRASSFAAGLFAGAAASTSLKTALLAASLVAGALVVVQAARRAGRRLPAGIAARFVCALVGCTIVPAIVAAWFAAHGALDDLVRCTILHNLDARPVYPEDTLLRLAAVPLFAAFVLYEVRRTLGARPEDPLALARAIFFAGTALYVAALISFWPLLTRQDYLPVHVQLAVLFTAWTFEVLALAPAARPARIARALTLTTLVLALGWRQVDVIQKHGTGGSDRYRAFLADVLLLTRPGEPVFDLKGESVYRPRGYYPVLETITRQRIERGEMPDDCAEELCRARVPVAILDSTSIPPSGRAFLDEHYLRAGGLRVVGALLSPSADGALCQRRFRLPFEARFAFVGEDGAPRGLLDGVACCTPRELAAGEHVYAPAAGEGRIAVVWAGAVERGIWRWSEPPALPSH